jgi:chromosome partitioning protein
MATSAKIITVFNQKGGCGKTTTSMVLAGEFGRRGYSVQVIDLDPQATSSRWRGQSDDKYPFPASVVNLAHHGQGTLPEIQMQSTKYDLLIIDCPPAIREASLSAALLVSDLALMPVQLTAADIWALDGAKRLLEAARQVNTSLLARVVPMRVNRRETLGMNVLAALKADNEIVVTESMLGQLGAYGQATLAGRAVHDVPRSANATAEVVALADEIGALMRMRRRGTPQLEVVAS